MAQAYHLQNFDSYSASMCDFPIETTADPATVDRLLSALARESRRLVIAYFENTGEETTSLDDLTAYIVAHHDEISREEARVRLYHIDLPKLETAGLIDYDDRTHTVRYREAPTAVDTDEWSQYFTQGEVA